MKDKLQTRVHVRFLSDVNAYIHLIFTNSHYPHLKNGGAA